MSNTNGKTFFASFLKSKFCCKQNRTFTISGLSIIVTMLLYMTWVTHLQNQREIMQSLSETLKNLQDTEAKVLDYYRKRDADVKLTHFRLRREIQRLKSSAVAKTQTTLPSRSGEEFIVDERGFWQGLGAVRGHIFDHTLATAIVQFLKVSTLLELGAGTGTYAKRIKAAGIATACYDGNPNTQDLSEGRCGVVDLSKPIDFSLHDWTLCLEVGEHIPREFEDIFIYNLVRGNRLGMILSWAVIGQGGTSHVNTRNNNYVRKQIVKRGYISDFDAEKILRASATYNWFNNTIMVFRKQH